MADKTRDSLGDRMKSSYEDRTRVMLPRRTFTILRADGKSFHTLTRGCEKPYDPLIVAGMDAAMLAICEEAQGCTFGYAQSDEISVVLGDFQTIDTCAWFDGNMQKMVSVTASVATAAFNEVTHGKLGRALFDCRAFVVPDPVECENYYIWRQQDATRNSIQNLGHAHFSHKEMHGMSCPQIQDALMARYSVNWNDRPVGDKRGRCAVYETGVGWRLDAEPPVFTQDREYLRSRLPVRKD